MKTPHKLSNLILLLIALIGNTAFSQSGSNLWEFPRSGGETVTEPSPAAEAMRRYIDFPVSYATGTAYISIPLVELPGGTVNVELGLSYHTEDEATETVGYDPRGLPNEIVKAVAGGGYTRSYVHYDAYDRPIRQWLPIPSIYGGTDAVKYFYNDSVPLERIQYPISRDDRPVEITTAGDWSAGSLDVTKLTDPDGCITLVFTDWRDLKILERHNTYFTYSPLPIYVISSYWISKILNSK